MDDVEGGTRRSSVRNHFLKRTQRAARVLAPNVHVDRDILSLRDLKQTEDLFSRGTGRVGDAGAEPEAPIADSINHHCFEPLQLFGGGCLVGIVGVVHEPHPVWIGRVTERPASDINVMEEFDSRPYVADRCPVVDDRLAVPGG